MHRQQGSVLQNVYSLFLTGFFILIFLRIIPVYYEHYAVKNSVEAVVKEINRDNLALADAKDSARRRFAINDVNPALADQFKFVKYDDKPYLVLDYEVRERFLFNLSLLFDFHLDYEISYDGEIKQAN